MPPPSSDRRGSPCPWASPGARPPRGQPHGARLGLLLLLGAAGCAPPRIPPAASPPQELAGAWDIERRATDDGEERIERQEWQIHQQAGALTGFVDRLVILTTTDGRVYTCNGRTTVEQRSRWFLRGEARGTGATIHLLAKDDNPACCPLDASPPHRCQLARQGAELLVRCDRETLHLARRLAPPVPLPLVERREGSLTGIWSWHSRSRDREGDVKIEEETWHLVQRGDRLVGFYDRAVRVRSGDGRRFKCNDRLQYSSQSRFLLRGQVKGNRIDLQELSYAADPDRCDSGRRDLDRYRGLVRSGEVIELSWGQGSQLLYRRY